MKFNELTIRELYAQAKSACIKALRLLDESQWAKFNYLTVDYVSPTAIEDDDDELEYFYALGHIGFDDVTEVSFKADLVWLGDGCDLAGPVEESVEIQDANIAD